MHSIFRGIIFYPAGLYLADYHVLAVCTDTDELDEGTGIFLDEGDVLLCVLGELFIGLADGNIAEVTVKLLVNRLCGIEEFLVGGEVLGDNAVNIVCNADLDLIELTDGVEVVEVNVVDTVDVDSVLDGDEVEPAAASGALGDGAVFMTEVSDSVAGFIEELGDEGTCADTAGVCLDYAVNIADIPCGKTCAGENTADGGVGGSDEGIGAEVNVQKGCLSTLADNELVLLQVLVKESDGVADIGLENFGIFGILCDDFIGIAEGFACGGELGVLRLDLSAYHNLKIIAVEMLYADAAALKLVAVCGTDAVLGGAELDCAAVLKHDIHTGVIRENDMSLVAYLEILIYIDAVLLEHFDLADENLGVENNTVADDSDGPVGEDTGRDEAHCELNAVDYDRMTGIVAACSADGNVGDFS